MSTQTERRLWTGLNVACSAAIAETGGILAAANGATIAGAFIAGATTFGASIGVIYVVLQQLGVFDSPEARGGTNPPPSP